MSSGGMQWDIIIVGAGPAGASTALHLTQPDSLNSARILILEKARIPRFKLCSGILTRRARSILTTLGIDAAKLGEEVASSLIRTRLADATLATPGLMTVVDRARFDASLVREAESRGVCIHDGEEVQGIRRRPRGLEVHTSAGRYFGRVVVAADGAVGPSRRWLRRSSCRSMITLQADATVRPGTEFHATRKCVFDFRPIGSRMVGYRWSTPSSTGSTGQSFGIGHVHLKKRDCDDEFGLRSRLRSFMAEYGASLETSRLQAHPSQWFDPEQTYSGFRLLLVGDAAGTDPLLGEGITSALLFGRVAADELGDAFRSGEFSFAGYKQAILRSPIGRSLVRKLKLAELIRSRDVRFTDLARIWLADVAHDRELQLSRTPPMKGCDVAGMAFAIWQTIIGDL